MAPLPPAKGGELIMGPMASSAEPAPPPYSTNIEDIFQYLPGLKSWLRDEVTDIVKMMVEVKQEGQAP